MHGQIGVLHQTCLDVVSPGDDPEQAGIGCRLVIGILDKHSHFAADALQACSHRQSQNVLRCIVGLASLHGQMNRLPAEQLDEAVPTDIDLDAIRSEVYAAE